MEVGLVDWEMWVARILARNGGTGRELEFVSADTVVGDLDVGSMSPKSFCYRVIMMVSITTEPICEQPTTE